MGNGKDLRPKDLDPFKSVMIHRLTKRGPQEKLTTMFFREEPREQDDKPLKEILQEVMDAL
jgi:hypothetical protein